MANIQPFNYQESTNIEEHNQIVNKVNEIVQVINDVNLDTINSEIANLKANATATDTEIVAIKNKDSQQDTEIDGITKNLVSNVTATFDNPSRELKISLGREASPSIDTTVVIPASSETGQYSAGNGITIENYQIAVDTNVVALKSDIPVVPDVTELTQRVQTLETEMPTKVNIAQGVENAGKILGIGPDGNVTPVNAGGSGEVWEEIDLSNIPTDFTVGDRIKISFHLEVTTTSPYFIQSSKANPIIEFIIYAENQNSINSIVYWDNQNNWVTIDNLFLSYINTQNKDLNVFNVKASYNGTVGTGGIKYDNIKDYCYKMWRCRAST